MNLGLLVNSFYALVATLCFSVIFNINRRYLLFTALGGGITWFVYLIFLRVSDHIMAYFVASICAAIYAEIMARVMKTPVTTFVICAVIPLVPGGGMYNTMLQIVQGHYNSSLSTGIDTLSIAGAIAVGIIFVSSCTKILVNLIRPRLHGAR